jgi:hypothetical protein
MKIYVVTSGSWEDYGIDKVFLSKEAAESYCRYQEKFYDYDDRCSVEEWDDSSDETFIPPKYSRVTLYDDYTIVIDPADNLEKTELTTEDNWSSIELSLDITSCNSREDIEKLARETVESKYPHWKEGKI